MKKLYNNLEIHFEKCEDVILTSGEYLETDRTPIGTQSYDSSSFNLMGSGENSSFNLLGSVQNSSSYDVVQKSYLTLYPYEL